MKATNRFQADSVDPQQQPQQQPLELLQSHVQEKEERRSLLLGAIERRKNGSQQQPS